MNAINYIKFWIEREEVKIRKDELNTVNHIKFWIIITVTLQFKQRESDDEIIKLKWMLWLVCAYLGVALQGHVREGLSYQRVTLGFELILLISFSFLLGVCCCLAENRFLLGERNIPSKTKIRKLANHAKNNLFLPKTTVYGRKNILRVFAQLTNVTFQLIWRLEFFFFPELCDEVLR